MTRYCIINNLQNITLLKSYLNNNISDSLIKKCVIKNKAKFSMTQEGGYNQDAFADIIENFIRQREFVIDVRILVHRQT